MRLSDAGLRRRKTKMLYANHRPPPCRFTSIIDSLLGSTEMIRQRSLEPIVRARILTADVGPTNRRLAKFVFNAGRGPRGEQNGDNLRRARVMQWRVSHVTLEVNVEASFY